MAQTVVEGSEKSSVKVNGWYPENAVLELTIHMFMGPASYDKSHPSLVALAKIVHTADDTGWLIRPRLIDYDESFYKLNFD
jgi:hypothetical protein